MFSALKKLFGSKQDRDVAKYEPVVKEINDVFVTLATLSNDELRNRTLDLRKRVNDYLHNIDTEIAQLKERATTEADFREKDRIYKEVDRLVKQRDEELEVVLNDILPEAFATVKEAARRLSEGELRVTATQADRNLAANPKKDHIRIEGNEAIYSNKWTAAGGEIEWKMVHYDVQLIGGMALHEGKIAEMQTGEGKTLVATLPAYLNGLAGTGVHVVTVNDYLARRDAEWIGPLMEFLQLSISCIDYFQPNSPERRAAYECDITYGTNNEFGFDYLRDNMARSQADKVQGKHHYAMVDEVDSVLIDDARTPLIISGPVTNSVDDRDYVELKPNIERLVAEQQKLSNKFLTEAKKLFREGYIGVEEGEAGMALFRAYRALPKSRPLIKFLSEEGVRVLLQKTENTYMAENNKRMPEVDAELLFTIDEKNRQVDLTDKGVTYLSQYHQDPNFFVMADLATNMAEVDKRTDINAEEKALMKNKISQEFGVKSKRLHAIHQLLKAYTLFEADSEYVVIDGQVKIVDEQTGRMMEGRRYSDGLHQALEAKENVKVGEITQTYATVTLQNFFRMYHKLAGMTGTAETEAGEFWDIYKLDVVVIPTNRPVQRKDQNDLIYKTEREKYNAVIDDITALSQAGRPVLVGTTSVEISEKLSRLLQVRGINHNVLNAKQHQREADIVAEAGRPGKVTIATNMAGRGTDIKINEQVKAAGGLAIIGTERHDSRRVDRQLRGRSGRQGDPGSSQFYVSLEDKLMRYFQSERIAKWMDRAGHKEGDVIQAGIVTKSIENAQKKVEENAFGVRKRLLEYDDVMNIQREAIYRKRNNALSGERLNLDLNNMFEGLIDDIVFAAKKKGDYDAFRFNIQRYLGFDTQLQAADFRENKDLNALADRLLEEFQSFYQRKMLVLVDRVMPTIRRVVETEPGRYKRIIIPFTDGSTHPLIITADIEKAVETNGRSIISDIEQTVTLAIIDDHWKEHLRSMDELKTTTSLASFEQKDPLVVYKMEAYTLFEGLVRSINEATTAYLAKGDLVIQDERDIQEARVPRRVEAPRTITNRSQEVQQAAREAGEAVSRPQKVETFQRQEAKIQRNDACPCGSGKKYKHCHGK
ncbi:preprotein translocase subunit SecA [Neolewinella lacunae]|uniref:Protein translocase subunit SecA n=1 Tax=Neolewinella lacunae TaxID=1517758 RepID=A0A923T8Z5_9BACT|nr:preprotein translocase subunit SecA [Neolewinella lacunae]MBC6995036.1 preprotein translocase subunit SecA [Neolewinella lacunae]MDN3633193.1 preprotein translocase subunit SecA [Neolewinella lacunae]